MKTVIIGGSQIGKSYAYARLKRHLSLAGYEVFDNGDVVIFDEAKNLQIPRINTGLRERLRATRQGLHNTPDGRIERRKGVVVQKGCGYMITAHDDHAVRNTGFGDTRAEAIRDYRNTFFHPETKA